MHRNNKTVIKIQHKLVQKLAAFAMSTFYENVVINLPKKKTQLPHTHTLNQIKLNTLKSERTFN